MIDDDGHAGASRALGEVDGERRIGREADGDQRVAGARLRQLFRPEPAHIVDEGGRNAELGQRIGQIMGDAEGPSLTEAMDRPRSSQKADSLVKLVALHALAQPRDRSRRRIGESEQKMDRIAAVAGVLLQRPEALGIIGPAVAQARAKQCLQLGKAGEAQGLGEPDEGRGLHFGVAGERGRGAEREFVRVLERVSRRLPEALRQVRLNLDQAALKWSKLSGGSTCCPVAHRYPLRRATPPHRLGYRREAGHE